MLHQNPEMVYQGIVVYSVDIDSPMAGHVSVSSGLRAHCPLTPCFVNTPEQRSVGIMTS